MRVGIVYGGTSSEAEASGKNALAIEGVLKSRGYEVCMLEYGHDIIAAIRKNRIDIVYMCVQGKYHGDGTLQSMLDYEQIPYTGSRTHAAMVINDKILCKHLFELHHIPTPNWKVLYKEQFQQKKFDFNEIGFSLVAKAPSQGGSFGIEMIRTPAELYKLDHVFQYDDPILLEEFIDGGFYTVGLWEKKGKLMTLKAVEGVETVGGVRVEKEEDLTLFTGEYDIEKPQLKESCLLEMEQLAEQVFQITNAKGVARVDFMVARRTGQPLVLEINAVPGLKKESLLSKAAEYSGVRYEDLIEDVLLSAWGSRENQQC